MIGDSTKETPDAARLIDAYFDGVISEVEFARLNDWLRADAVNLRQFATAAMLHTKLRDTLHAADMQSFFCRDEQSNSPLSLVDPRNIILMLEEEAAAHPHPVIEPVEPAEPPRRKQPEVVVPWQAIGYAATAAATVLLFVFAQWVTSLGDKPSDSAVVRNGPSSVVDAPPLVATLTESLLASWSGNDRAIPINARLEAGRRTLSKGVVEVEFDSGARVVIEAPAQFELLSSDRMAVYRGRIVANVPEQAIGFTVLAEKSAIVDLGTEFGIDISQSGDVGVHVLDGEVALLPESGKSQAGTRTLTVGEARRVRADNSAVEEIDFDKEGFLRQVPVSPYELAILKNRPLAFWRFNEAANGPRVDSLVGESDLVGDVGGGVTLGYSSTRPENGNHSAQFSGDHDGIDLGRLAALGLTHDFTLESWVFVSGATETLGPKRVVSTFSESATRSGLAFGVAGRGFTGAGFPSLAPHFTFYGVYDLVGKRGLQFNQWHHLVVTVDASGRPRIYLDGGEVECQVRREGKTFQALPSNWDSQFRGIATAGSTYMGKNPPVPSGQVPPPERWQGGIDEIVVFGRALSESEIKSHFDAGMIYSLTGSN